jgi:hypothetical protein
VISPSTSLPGHRLIRVTVRPARAAVFVSAEEAWHSKAVRVIQCLTRTWGGAAGIIVPMFGDVPDQMPDLFWPILESFDADWLSSYRTSWRGQQMHNPEQFEKYANDVAGEFAAKTGESIDDARRSIFTDSDMRRPLDNFAPPGAVIERVHRTLSPYRHSDTIDQHFFTADDETHRPLVDMTRIRRLEGDGLMNVLDTSALGERMQLLLAMRLGALSPSYSAAIDAREISKIHDRAEPAHAPVLVELAYRGRVEGHSWSMHRAIRGATGSPDPMWLDPNYINASPFGWTTAGCTWYSMWARSRAEEAPFTIVAGDTFVDFCIAYALERMTQRAVWLPLAPADESDEADAMREAAADFLMDARRVSDAPTRFSSASLDDAAIAALFAEVKATKRGYTARTDLSEVDAGPLREDDVRVKLPRRLLDRERQGEMRFEPFQGDEMAGLLNTPQPSLGTSEDPDAVDWQVEAVIDDTPLPTRHVIARLLTRDHVFGENVRSSRDGTTYVSHSRGFVPAGMRLDQRLARPRLRLPPPAEVFTALLAAAGMRSEISPAGAFTSGAMELLGGFAPLVRAFTEPTSRTLLEAYRTPAKRRTSADEDAGRGVYLALFQRRFLSMADFADASSAPAADVRTLLDSYTERGILHRGIVLKCRRCRFDGWYRAGEFTQTFTCTRCRASWALSLQAWREPLEEPTWRYELDEIVYQAVVENARAPVLALQALRAGARPFGGFVFGPELEVYQGDEHVAEVDIWAVVEGRICIGEAKTIDRLADTAEREQIVAQRLARIADAVTADELVAATTQSAWRPETRAVLEAAIKGTRTRLRILEGDALEAAAQKV